MVTLREDGVDVGRTAQPRFKHTDQLAAAQVAGNIPFRTEHDAVAGQRPVNGNFTVIGAERAAYLDHRLLLAVSELPVVEGGVVFADDDAGVGRQITRRQRPAVAGKIVGRGAEQAAVGSNFPGQNARIGRLAEADADVHCVFGQIKRSVGELENDLDLGPELGKVSNQRGEMAAAKAEGGIDPQQAARAFVAGRERAFQTFDIAQDLLAVFKVTLALRGQT